uniref:Uncharacterized protein n=1 Tax=Utricularia reniformis TaxID=192314 RepID=A0A1Y0AZN8_9LAMI|nr:hypothetical protein AEK19_MT0355 [Utricularia reniformis]ART30627.1 hypothetical protein AEK19_MT0355 [Utricularia reniformis]
MVRAFFGGLLNALMCLTIRGVVFCLIVLDARFLTTFVVVIRKGQSRSDENYTAILTISFRMQRKEVHYLFSPGAKLNNKHSSYKREEEELQPKWRYTTRMLASEKKNDSSITKCR